MVGALSAPESALFKPNKGKELNIEVRGAVYSRLPIKTPLITEHDDLIEVLRTYVKEHLRPDDTLFISEKIVALTQGRIIRIRDIKPSKLARLLARNVNNGRGTKNFRGFGHGTSMGMELFIQEAGYPRALFAAAIAAVTRPLGIKGMFYRICGKRAKSIDCPMSFTIHPYLHYAKLAPLHSDVVAAQVKDLFGNDVVIVDANYRGVFSLGKSDKRISERFIQEVLRDNPAGQADEMTPFFIVRKEKEAAVKKPFTLRISREIPV